MTNRRSDPVAELDHVTRALARAASSTVSEARSTLAAHGIDPDAVATRTITHVERLRKQRVMREARANLDQVREALRAAQQRLAEGGDEARQSLALAMAGDAASQVEVYFHKLKSMSDAELRDLRDDEMLLALWAQLDSETMPDE